MPKKMTLVDYSKCDPHACEGGICLAALACPRKVMKQEAPFEMPDLNSAMCVGCSVCMPACPLHAIRAM